MDTDRLRIRLAAIGDAEGIALESMAEIEHNLHWRWTPQRIRRAIRDRETNVAVATAGEDMLAFGIMKYREEVAHLLLFAVRADVRRRGVGSALLGWLEEVGRAAGIGRFRLEARRDNEPALAFYRRHGYCETEAVPGMYERKVDGVRLEKVTSQAATRSTWRSTL
ncbi:MAG: GNAT family N-acetyltransferase [Bacillota bacterium]